MKSTIGLYLGTVVIGLFLIRRLGVRVDANGNDIIRIKKESM